MLGEGFCAVVVFCLNQIKLNSERFEMGLWALRCIFYTHLGFIALLLFLLFCFYLLKGEEDP